MELERGDALILVQHAISGSASERQVIGRLAGTMSEAEVLNVIDELVATQRVRRIGPDELENNESHTALPELPGRLSGLL